MSNGGGNDNFFEEKCAPMRRGGNASKQVPLGFPNELKPKFPKPDEIMPIDQPQTPQTPMTPVESPAVIKTLDGDELAAQNVEVECQDVPSKDVETPDIQEKKKKKKPKQPKKKDEGTAMAVFMDDDEPKKDDPNNAMGQFVDDDEDEKKNKKKEKKEKMKVGEKEKDSNRDKGKEAKDKVKAKAQKQPKTESFRQKGKQATLSNRQKKTQGSVRRSHVAKPQNPVGATVPAIKVAPKPHPLPLQAPAPPQVPMVKPVPTVTAEPKVTREPTEGFFRGMYSKAKQKITAMSKNPNAIASSSSSSDDTFIAIDAVIKPEVTAVYGAASDYPNRKLPGINEKNHPDKLFPGGRPYWLIRDKKPPETKVIMMSTIQEGMRTKQIAIGDRQKKPETFTPYCPNVKQLEMRDKEFFLDYTKMLTNTVHNSCDMKGWAFAISKNNIKIERPPREMPKSNKRVGKITLPTMCTVYARKEQKKKQPFTKKPFQTGSKLKKKKKKSSANSNSQAD